MGEDNIVLTEDGGGGYLVLDHLSEHIKQNPDITVTQEQEGAGENNTRKETAQEVIQKRVVKFSEDVIV